MGYTDVTQSGAVGDGVMDDTVAVQRAFEAARGGDGHVHFPARGGKGSRTYSLGRILVHGGTRVTADEGVVLVSRITRPQDHLFECVSSLGQGVRLAANASSGEQSVTLTSAPRVSPGDVVIVGDNAFKFGDNKGPNRELAKVVSVAADRVTLDRGLIGNYRLDRSAQLVPVTQAARAIRFEGIRCHIPAGNDGGAFYFQDAYGCQLWECGSTGQRGQPGVQIWRSAFVTVRGGLYADGQDLATPGHGYGCNIAQSSHHCWVVSAAFRNVRECAVASNTRFSGYIDCESRGSYDNAFNAHEDGSEDCWFIHCTSYDARSKGFCAGGTAGWAADKRINFIACHAHNSGYMAFWADGAEGVESEGIRFINCIAFHPGGRTNPSYGFYCSRTVNLQILDCQVNADHEPNCRAGIDLEYCRNAKIIGGEIRDVTNGWGILHASCAGIEVANVNFTNVKGQAVYAEPKRAPSTNVRLRDIP